jgi:hypothetical protein
MTYDVVVLIEREMSEGDARSVAALHARLEEPVNYHLLVSSHPDSVVGGPLALLGSSFDDVTGVTTAPPGPSSGSSTPRFGATITSSAPYRSSTALADLADPAVDLASVIEHSSRRLRAASRDTVQVSITHGEILLALMTMVRTTSSQEVVVVAWPDTAARFLCSDWAAKARKLLKVPRVRILEHDT